MNLSDQQTRKFSLIAENMFAEKEELLEMPKTFNNEIIVQMNSNTADSDMLEALLN